MGLYRRIERMEWRIERIEALVTDLHKLVRGEKMDALIDTMREEALNLRELSRLERERVCGTV
ncbi:MAG: hypothetical protein IJ610_07850 [Bacteroidaceae bacterium]|nr:hypothetical protein [Bacteroidaceae bacterium]